jgi:hypothetical protein
MTATKNPDGTITITREIQDVLTPEAIKNRIIALENQKNNVQVNADKQLTTLDTQISDLKDALSLTQ